MSGSTSVSTSSSSIISSTTSTSATPEPTFYLKATGYTAYTEYGGEDYNGGYVGVVDTHQHQGPVLSITNNSAQALPFILQDFQEDWGYNYDYDFPNTLTVAPTGGQYDNWYIRGDEQTYSTGYYLSVIDPNQLKTGVVGCSGVQIGAAAECAFPEEMGDNSFYVSSVDGVLALGPSNERNVYDYAPYDGTSYPVTLVMESAAT